jgi:uncharacterized membrane protein YtjA (UPF0391 family)
MLSWAVAFLSVSLIAAVAGFAPGGGILVHIVLIGAALAFVVAATKGLVSQRSGDDPLAARLQGTAGRRRTL